MRRLGPALLREHFDTAFLEPRGEPSGPPRRGLGLGSNDDADPGYALFLARRHGVILCERWGHDHEEPDKLVRARG